MRAFLMVLDLVVRKGMEDRRLRYMRCSRRMVFDSLMSSSLCMLYRIRIIVHELVEPSKNIIVYKL